MIKKGKHVIGEEKWFSNKKLVVLSTTIAIMIILGFLLPRIFLQTREVKFSLKAAIIDQVGDNYPSSPETAMEFNESATELLKGAGFNVSYYESKSVTVNFYKDLAKSNYGLIILRAHSALRKDKPIVDFFTSEKFVEGKYPPELVTKGFYEWEKNVSYCAITPQFIRNVDGFFPKSVIIAMGCNSLNETCTGMADSFIQKGAKVYIGWTGFVNLLHADSETVRLLKILLNENKTIAEAISQINPDPYWRSRMDFHPSSAANLKVSDLIASTKASTTLQITFNNLKQRFRAFVNLVCLKFKNLRFYLQLSQLSNYKSVLKPSYIIGCEAHHLPPRFSVIF